MTSSSPPGSPLGLAQARKKAAGGLRIVAHNGAAVWGGAEINLVHLLAGLQRRGHEVILCCNHDIVADRATRFLIPTTIRPLRGDLMFNDALSFAKFLKQQQPDALVIGTFKKIWLGGWAGRRAGVPLNLSRVSLASDTPRRWKYRYALKNWIDLVTLNAESMRVDFLRADADLADRVSTLHDGVDAPRKRAAPGALRTQLRIPADARVIGTTARLSRQKRLERLLEATAQLPGVHCVIAGEGSERAHLEAETRRLNLQGRVHLLGFRDDVGDVLDALDVFVITSDQEGMSNAMLEAMALGVPAVSTPVSGAAEALEPLSDGSTPGIVTRGFEPGEIASAVNTILAQPSRYGAAAKQSAQERFSLERMVADFEGLLRAGIARKGAQ